MTVAEQRREKREKNTAMQGIRKPWGLEGSMKSSSIVWWKSKRPWKGRRAEWVQASQDRFGSHVLCGPQMTMCRLHQYEEGSSAIAGKDAGAKQNRS